MRDRPVSRAAFVFRICGVIGLLCAIWFWPIGTVPVRPSFDCTTAYAPTEKAICADPQLAAVDADVAQYYQDNLQTAGNFGDAAKIRTLQHDEQQFIAQRNQCGPAEWCIQRAYATWDQHLEDVGGAPRRVTPGRSVFAQSRTYLGAYLLHRQASR